MKRKLFLGVGFTGLLLILLSVSLYEALQRQETRSKAVNDVETIIVTPLDLRRGRKTQVGVVLNRLDPKFQYRLVFGLSYEKNPATTGQAVSEPKSRKKTVKVAENKTYKFTFATSDCYWIAKLDVQLYFREAKRVWKPVAAPTTHGNSKLSITCPALRPLASPEPITTPVATDSALLLPTPPTLPTPETFPDESSLPDPDPAAQNLEELEDIEVLEQESQTALTASGKPSANSSPVTSPTSSIAPQASPLTPFPSLVSQATSISPSPVTAPNTTALPSPPTSTTATSRGSFGQLLTELPEANVGQPQPSISPVTPGDTTNTPVSATPAAPSTHSTATLPTLKTSPASINPTPSATAVVIPSSGQTPATALSPAPAAETSLPLFLLGGAAAILTVVGILLLL